MHLLVPLTLGRWGAMSDGISDVLPSTPSTSTSSVVQLVHFPNILINGEVLLPICLCIIWLKFTIFSLSAITSYSIIQMFNIKATRAYHPIIQNEVHELLGNCATEPSTGVACFYSNVFVVLKCTCG